MLAVSSLNHRQRSGGNLVDGLTIPGSGLLLMTWQNPTLGFRKQERRLRTGLSGGCLRSIAQRTRSCARSYWIGLTLWCKTLVLRKHKVTHCIIETWCGEPGVIENYLIIINCSPSVLWYYWLSYRVCKNIVPKMTYLWSNLHCRSLSMTCVLHSIWARERCRISLGPRFLTECRMRWLNHVNFVLLHFVLFAFSGLCLVVVLCLSLICLLSCIFQHVLTWMALYSLMVLMCC